MFRVGELEAPFGYLTGLLPPLPILLQPGTSSPIGESMSRPYYQRIPYRLLRVLRSEVEVRVGKGTLWVPTAPVMSLAFLYWRFGWKTEVIQAVLSRRSGALLDVGANVGTTLLDYLAGDHPRECYCGFEPNPACCSFLCEVIRRNGLRDCTLVPTGLADTNGVLPLHLRPGTAVDLTATLVQSLRPRLVLETMSVPCFRFDDLRKSLVVDRIALVKIDVEGAELEVLRGMAESLGEAKPYVLCEVLHADRHVDEAWYRGRIDALQDLLHTLGYAIFLIKKSPSGAVLRLEAVGGFPIKHWSHETAEDCDYLFVPQCARTELENLGLKVGN